MTTPGWTVAPIELEELDIEAFAREHPADRGKPCARFYVIRVDRERKRVRHSEMTGAEILSLVGKTPETHKLFQKFRGGETEVERFFRKAAEHDLAIVKVHSHPSGYGDFSRTDDDSDFNLFESVYGWVDGDRPHASAIMLPDGRMRARAVLAGGAFAPVRHVEVVGDDVVFWSDEPKSAIPAFVDRHAQLFGSGTTALLGRLRVAVVGCSGTGSPVIEQLVRLGVGELVLVDPDHVEERNLNRILGATMQDANEGRLKVEVIGRHIAGSRLARYYLLPYVDVGVKLEALDDGTINQVAGSVHYLQPTGLDFVDRGVFSLEALAAEDLLRTSSTNTESDMPEGMSAEFRSIDLPSSA